MADPTASLAALGLTAKGGREAHITGLAVDSRAVRSGFLFAALPGTAAHGAQFVPQALRQGASAILTDPEGARLAQEALSRITGEFTADDLLGEIFSRFCIGK